MPRIVAKSWTSLLILIATAPAYAGTLGLAWSPVSNATGYRVYYGRQAGSYDRIVDVGASTSATITNLADCSDYFLAVKAYNGAGESEGFSNEIAGWARPTISIPSPSVGMQGADLAFEIPGANFRPGATVTIDNPHVHLGPALVLDCRRVSLSIALDPDTSGLRAAEIGKFAVTVSNPDGTYNTLPQGFEVLIDPARFDVNQSRASTRGRIDGEDTVWMARLFASRENDALFDPDFDLDGNGEVDGNDLVYIAINLGRCWNGTTWTTDACETRP